LDADALKKLRSLRNSSGLLDLSSSSSTLVGAVHRAILHFSLLKDYKDVDILLALISIGPFK